LPVIPEGGVWSLTIGPFPSVGMPLGLLVIGNASQEIGLWWGYWGATTRDIQAISIEALTCTNLSIKISIVPPE